MIFVDTHTHLYAEEFDLDRAEVVSNAIKAGVTHMLLPDVDSSSREAMMAMAAEYSCCTPMIGVHPTSINDNPAWREEILAVERALYEDATRFCAVGEIGIDLYWSKEYETEQRQALRAQIDLSLAYDLPIAIHCRDAWEQLIEELEKYQGKAIKGVIHAFTGTIDHYKKLTELGDFKFGIGGVVTFKKSALAPVVAEMKLEDIILETDAPYLTPAPHRGKRNESAYVPHIAEFIAQLHVISVEEVAAVTTATAEKLFRISAKE